MPKDAGITIIVPWDIVEMLLRSPLKGDPLSSRIVGAYIEQNPQSTFKKPRKERSDKGQSRKPRTTRMD